MAIVRVNPQGDLALVNGSFSFIEGPVFVRQKISARFQFFLGEWFLDRRQGAPYLRDLFKKNPDIDVARSLLRRIALTTTGVSTVPTFELLYDSSTRSARFNFQANLKSGGAIVVKPTDRDFLVSLTP